MSHCHIESPRQVHVARAPTPRYGRGLGNARQFERIMASNTVSDYKMPTKYGRIIASIYDYSSFRLGKITRVWLRAICTAALAPLCTSKFWTFDPRGCMCGGDATELGTRLEALKYGYTYIRARQPCMLSRDNY